MWLPYQCISVKAQWRIWRRATRRAFIDEFRTQGFTGPLFKNEKRKDTDADYNGSGLIDGKEYWLNL